MEKQLKFGLANYIRQLNLSRKVDWKHGWIIKGGQKHFTTHHEKGARDKNPKTQGRKTFEVGHTNDRKEIDQWRPFQLRWKAEERSHWFDDQTREIQ